jgi:hypothetical protein
MGRLNRLPFSKSDYHAVFDEKNQIIDEAEPLHGRQVREVRRLVCWPTFIIYTTLATLTVALIVLTVMYTRHLGETAPQVEFRCGNSIEEAIEAGCSFDMLSKAWLPAQCPRYGSEEYVNAATGFNKTRWQYWADPEGKIELDDHQLSMLVHQNKAGEKWSWAGTDREHLTHCAWMIIRLAHSHMVGARVDALTANFPHTKHCTLMMLQRAMSAPNLDTVFTRGDIVFGSC